MENSFSLTTIRGVKMSKILDNYHNDKDLLNSIVLSKFPFLKVGNILATQIWKMHTLSYKKILVKFFSIVLCDKYSISYSKNEDESIALLNASAGMMRGDNELIINNAFSFIKPCTKINIYKINKINLKRVIKKLITIFKYSKELYVIKNIDARLFYAASLTIINQLSEELDLQLRKISFLVTFMDSDIIENYITQTIQHFGGKVAALQHGQRFYINAPCDSYVGMDNFTADYKLVWSHFSQIQYLNAGYPIERLPIVGSTKYLDLENKTHNINNKIAIFFDGPLSYNSRESNLDMLRIVSQYCEKKALSYLIKLHPVDSIEKYNCVNQENIQIVDSKLQIEEISNLISFAIVHSSGVAIDLLILGIPVLVFGTPSVNFPIGLPKDYYFNSCEDLENILCTWKNNYDTEIKKFEIIRKNYMEENPRELHNSFFSQFKRGYKL